MVLPSPAIGCLDSITQRGHYSYPVRLASSLAQFCEKCYSGPEHREGGAELVSTSLRQRLSRFLYPDLSGEGKDPEAISPPVAGASARGWHCHLSRLSRCSPRCQSLFLRSF